MREGRRHFLSRIGLGVIAGALASPWQGEARHAAGPAPAGASYDDWDDVRDAFELAPDVIHLSALFFASNPKPVREAIEKYRTALNANPALFLERENDRLQDAAIDAAAHYLHASPGGIALTDSTTMGLGLVYNGLRLHAGDELLVASQNYYSSDEALRLAAFHSGATIRTVSLYDDIRAVREEGIVENVARALGPKTRLLAVTWIHSSTGLKLPIGRIAEAVERANRGRDEDDRILLSVDGVHGFGVEDIAVKRLGCDFFIAGCHKWLFGPRGTGIVWGSESAWNAVRPTIPSFLDGELWRAWIQGRTPKGKMTARRMSPGGFKPFEHQWALAEAFAFHEQIGKERIARRTHELASQLKEGLAAIAGVTLYTPRSESLSSGIVCFDVDGLSAPETVKRLGEKKVIATVTPYATAYARLAPCIYNTPKDVEEALRAVRSLR